MWIISLIAVIFACIAAGVCIPARMYVISIGLFLLALLNLLLLFIQLNK